MLASISRRNPIIFNYFCSMNRKRNITFLKNSKYVRTTVANGVNFVIDCFTFIGTSDVDIKNHIYVFWYVVAIAKISLCSVSVSFSFFPSFHYTPH